MEAPGVPTKSLVDFAEEVLAFSSSHAMKQRGALPSFVEEPIDDGVTPSALLKVLCFGWVFEFFSVGEVVEDQLTLINVLDDEYFEPHPWCS